MNAPTRSTVAGVLIGGAVGDAAGAPFEGLWPESLPAASELLSGYHEYHGYPEGQYTDDTQLTLATIESVVEEQDVVAPDIARRIAELWRHQSVIGPGGACTQAAERYLATGKYHNMGAPPGQAGNGTAMRTAALGLWFGKDREALIASIAEVSRITHRDSRSVAGGVVVAVAAAELSREEILEPTAFCNLLAESCRDINSEFAALLEELPQQMKAGNAREFVAFAGQKTREFERPIISPFVIPTVLASVYCMLSHPDSWGDAVVAAIRMGGDVDTLGAITGGLAGARHGIEAIPPQLVHALQDNRRIQDLSARYHAAILRRAVS